MSECFGATNVKEKERKERQIRLTALPEQEEVLLNSSYSLVKGVYYGSKGTDEMVSLMRLDRFHRCSLATCRLEWGSFERMSQDNIILAGKRKE